MDKDFGTDVLKTGPFGVQRVRSLQSYLCELIALTTCGQSHRYSVIPVKYSHYSGLCDLELGCSRPPPFSGEIRTTHCPFFDCRPRQFRAKLESYC